MSDEDQLGAAVRKLVGQVSHWTPPRWAASALSGPITAEPPRAAPVDASSGPVSAEPNQPGRGLASSGSVSAEPNRAGRGVGASGASRAELVHDLVQWMADRCAEAEGRPALPVPRLDNDLALPDQLQVVAADLRRFASPAVQQDAADRINAIRGAFA